MNYPHLSHIQKVLSSPIKTHLSMFPWVFTTSVFTTVFIADGSLISGRNVVAAATHQRSDTWGVEFSQLNAAVMARNTSYKY